MRPESLICSGSRLKTGGPDSGAMRPKVGDITGQAMYPIHDLDAIVVMVRIDPPMGTRQVICG